MNDNEMGTESPSEDELDILGPGCFVRVQKEGQCFWAELESDPQQDRRLIAIVHGELADRRCPNAPKEPQASFDKEEITAMGCGQYCWC